MFKMCCIMVANKFKIYNLLVLGAFIMKNEWISVKECAELGGISTQSVYKKLNHKNNQENFTGHVRTIMGVKYLDSEAVNLILGKYKVHSPEDKIMSELSNVMNQLNETNKKKVLNFAKQTLEVSKY